MLFIIDFYDPMLFIIDFYDPMFIIDFYDPMLCCRYESIERRKPSASSHNEVFISTTAASNKPTVSQVNIVHGFQQQNSTQIIFKFTFHMKS